MEHRTEVGKLYLRKISPALEMIEEATDTIVLQKHVEKIQVRVYATFATKWLLPRLRAFQQEYPSIQLQLSQVVEPVDFDKEPVDLAIQFGNGSWKNVGSRLLVRDKIQPVCSPKILRRGEVPSDFEDLKKFQIIQSRYRRRDWADWIRSMNARVDLNESKQLNFESSALAYQAAAEGMGVVMGQINLLQTEIETNVFSPRCGVVIMADSVDSIGRRGSDRKAATPASVLSSSA